MYVSFRKVPFGAKKYSFSYSSVPFQNSSFATLSQGKQSDECTLPSRNLYKCKQVVYVIVVCVFCSRLSLQSCLHVYPLFYTDIVAIFLFIYLFCLLCFWSFLLSF